MNLIHRPYADAELGAADRRAIALFNRPARWFTTVLLPALFAATLLLAPGAPTFARLTGALLLFRAAMLQQVRSRLDLDRIFGFAAASLLFELPAAVVLCSADLAAWARWPLVGLFLLSSAEHLHLHWLRSKETRRFANVAGVTWTQPLLPLLWWRLERTWRRRSGSTVLPDVVTPDLAQLEGSDAHLTWIGHATFFMRLGGVRVVTDPIWTEQLYYMKRLTRPGVPIDMLPGVDVVTVTHNHFDHLDLSSLVELERRHHPTFIVPRNNGWILRRSGIQNILELDWWQSHRVGDLEITLVPAQHWSQRGPFDKNQALWGGFVYRAPEGTAYHAGDTAYEEQVFAQIAERFSIDWAMLPIAAYDPEWFLQTQHINPEDAGLAFEHLAARIFVAMHYGTYALTDEPVGEPLERARAWFEHHNRSEALWALDIGETRSLGATAGAAKGNSTSAFRL